MKSACLPVTEHRISDVTGRSRHLTPWEAGNFGLEPDNFTTTGVAWQPRSETKKGAVCEPAPGGNLLLRALTP